MFAVLCVHGLSATAELLVLQNFGVLMTVHCLMSSNVSVHAFSVYVCVAVVAWFGFFYDCHRHFNIGAS